MKFKRKKYNYVILNLTKPEDQNYLPELIKSSFLWNKIFV